MEGTDCEAPLPPISLSPPQTPLQIVNRGRTTVSFSASPSLAMLQQYGINVLPAADVLLRPRESADLTFFFKWVTGCVGGHSQGEGEGEGEGPQTSPSSGCPGGDAAAGGGAGVLLCPVLPPSSGCPEWATAAVIAGWLAGWGIAA